MVAAREAAETKGWCIVAQKLGFLEKICTMERCMGKLAEDRFESRTDVGSVDFGSVFAVAGGSSGMSVPRPRMSGVPEPAPRSH